VKLKGRPRSKWEQKIMEDVTQKEEHGRNWGEAMGKDKQMEGLCKQPLLGIGWFLACDWLVLYSLQLGCFLATAVYPAIA
jgi:hypothetical protein